MSHNVETKALLSAHRRLVVPALAAEGLATRGRVSAAHDATSIRLVAFQVLRDLDAFRFVVNLALWQDGIDVSARESVKSGAACQLHGPLINDPNSATSAADWESTLECMDAVVVEVVARLVEVGLPLLDRLRDRAFLLEYLGWSTMERAERTGVMSMAPKPGSPAHAFLLERVITRP
jgi:hypothetical protein